MFLSYMLIYSVDFYQGEVLFEFLIIEVRIPDVLRRSKKFNRKHWSLRSMDFLSKIRVE